MGLIKQSQGSFWNKKKSEHMYVSWLSVDSRLQSLKNKKTAGILPPGNLSEDFFFSMQLYTFNYKVELNVGLVCPWKETGCCIWQHLTIIHQSGSKYPGLFTETKFNNWQYNLCLTCQWIASLLDFYFQIECWKESAKVMCGFSNLVNTAQHAKSTSQSWCARNYIRA